MGRSGFPNPARLRLIASHTCSMAPSCPKICFFSSTSISLSRPVSEEETLFSGTFAIFATTFSTSPIVMVITSSSLSRYMREELAAVRERIKRNPFLRDVSVNRQGPEGISIEVVERQPVAIVAADVLLYVDEEGVVLPPAHSEKLFDLPVITGAVPAAECVPGKAVTNVAMREALRLVVLSRMIGEDLFRRISDVQVLEDGDLLFHTAEAGVPVFLGRGSLGEKLVTFDGFWGAIVDRRGPQQLQQVDLRFADQVVVRWSGEAAPR